MLRNYLMSAVRNLSRHRWYVLINVTGLSLGITFALIIFMHLGIELGFDSQAPDRDRIFRVIRVDEDGDGSAEQSPMLGDQLLAFFSEIESYTRVIASRATVFYTNDHGNRTTHRIDGGYFADSTFFDMFGIKALHGDTDLSLRDPYTIVITESVSRRMFGDHIPVGEMLETAIDRPRKITAVIPDPPFDSHIQYEFLYPMKLMENFVMESRPDMWQSRSWSGAITYFKLHEQASISTVRERMLDFMLSYFADVLEEDEEITTVYTCQPLPSIHLLPGLSDDNGPRTNAVYLKIFAVVAVIILLIAAINFVNITLALGLRRTREVGIRKVMGAGSSQVGQQFAVETGVLILLAGVVSLVLLSLAFPYYTNLTGYPLTPSYLWSVKHLPLLLGVLLGVFLVGGIYPAIHASTFVPAQTIRASRDPRAIVGFLRKGLLTFQFIISSAILFCTAVIYMQADFLLNRDPGFDTEHVVAFMTHGVLRDTVFDNLDEVKAELLRNPNIVSVSCASSLPGNHYSGESLSTEDTPPDVWPGVQVLRGDTDIIETLGLELAEGSSFAGLGYGTPAFIPNETAIRVLGIEDPVGKAAWNNIWGPYEGQIVGVVRDFNHEVLHKTISPLVIENRPWGTTYNLVRIRPGGTKEALAWVDHVFEQFAPNGVYDMQFLEDRMQQLYESERNLSAIFRTFGLLGIIISALGLLGITALMVHSKRKEIGIRKVLGASEAGIHRLISGRFLVWVLVANVVALPLSALAMNRWLANFAYHITIPVALYPGTLVASVLIAWMVMSALTISAARTNPVTVLRTDG